MKKGLKKQLGESKMPTEYDYDRECDFMDELENRKKEVKMEEQKNEETNWLQQELEKVNETSFDGERKPALKLEENKIVKMTIDFSEPFQKWEDQDGENITIKKIIPVKVGEVEFVWWLNVKNPIYSEIIKKGAEGQTEFKVLQTGNQKTTKYTLVEE